MGSSSSSSSSFFFLLFLKKNNCVGKGIAGDLFFLVSALYIGSFFFVVFQNFSLLNYVRSLG